MTKIPVRKDVAMTGEVTLRGRVLAIGGLKEKILAAHRGGIKVVIIPKENEKDLKDIPKIVLKDLKIVIVNHVDQVLVNALEIKDAKDLFKSRSAKSAGIRAQYTGHPCNIEYLFFLYRIGFCPSIEDFFCFDPFKFIQVEKKICWH